MNVKYSIAALVTAAGLATVAACSHPTSGHPTAASHSATKKPATTSPAAPTTHAPKATRTPAPAVRPSPKAAPTTTQPPAPSDPKTVVTDFYAAINNRDYAEAWRISQGNLGGSYSAFMAGFKDTNRDALTITGVSGSAVQVDLKAFQNDGTVKHYTGTYNVSDSHITSGHLQLAQATPKPAPAPAGHVVIFTVTGTGQPDITYGSDSDNRSGNTHTSQYGLDYGDVPFHATLPTDESALYYNITAQLQGSGDISCSLTIDGKLIATGHASGGYNICTAQAGKGLFGGWEKE